MIFAVLCFVVAAFLSCFLMCFDLLSTCFDAPAAVLKAERFLHMHG